LFLPITAPVEITKSGSVNDQECTGTTATAKLQISFSYPFTYQFVGRERQAAVLA